MDVVNFFLDINDGDYSFKNPSNIKMTILGCFLTSDVGSRPSSFKKWGFDNKSEYTCSNATALEKENDYILLTDFYSEETTPTVLKMTHQQFIQILTDWEEKVLKLKPKEVTITYENDQFIIETKN